MDIKNNIIKYFKTNHLKLNNIRFDETKGFVLETNKGILTSSNLPLLNYISRNDMEYIKMELNDVSVIDYVSQYLLNNDIKILNISLNVLEKKIILHTTKGNLSNESFPELSFLTLEKLSSLYELCKIEENSIQEIINNLIFNIKNNVDDVLSSYILHSIKK